VARVAGVRVVRFPGSVRGIDQEYRGTHHDKQAAQRIERETDPAERAE